MEYILPPEWFRKGGSLYNLAIQTQGALKPDKKYQFPMQGNLNNLFVQSIRFRIQKLN